jgi:hypothetical protein
MRGSSKDVRFVTKDQAKLVLEIWTTNKEWESRESKFMMNVLERDNTNDLFVGYCPEYQNKHTIRYLFHMRVAFGENPYLSVQNGVSCPFDNSDLSSAIHLAQSLFCIFEVAISNKLDFLDFSLQVILSPTLTWKEGIFTFPSLTKK